MTAPNPPVISYTLGRDGFDASELQPMEQDIRNFVNGFEAGYRPNVVFIESRKITKTPGKAEYYLLAKWTRKNQVAMQKFVPIREQSVSQRHRMD
ncbi:Hypothetical predicted protein [Lecanosticta acicola]|uniref:Uncharacterized protein n=1 Tax=Lecanosticta acicola TaxID=111012 RepID=A0AAI8YZE2_9PEZI|nr:Hypothetical predicted protein [Lecanosticta acicola]